MAADPDPLPLSERWQLTKRLLAHALHYKAWILLGGTSMVVAVFAEMLPIGLVLVFFRYVLGASQEQMGALGGVGSGGEALESWVVGAGRTLMGLVGAGEGDERIAAWVVVLAGIVVASLLSAAATFGNQFVAKYLAALVTRDLRESLLAKLLHLPLGYFSRRKIGDLVSRFSTDVQVTYRTVNIFFSEMLLQPFLVLAAAVIALFLHWQLALLLLVAFPLVVTPVRRIGKRVLKRSKRSLHSLGETLEAVTQVLSGLRVVKAFRMEDAELRQYGEVNRRWLRRQAALLRAKASNRALTHGLLGVSLAALLGTGSYLLFSGLWGLSVGVFAALVLAFIKMSRPLRRISVAYNNWQESLGAAGRLFEVLDHPEPAPDPPDAVEMGPIRREVRFEDVWFSYEGDDGPAEDVLQGVSFSIPAGSTVALVGPSGAGKSTVADLLFRFYEPTAGRITVDGVPITEVSRGSLLAQVAVVSQEPFLFNASVRANIAYGRPGATEEEIRAAARAAYIHDVITALPLGYDTVVGERGATLSGGQLQRITIARAILKDASLLLLDEATSNLDTESEQAVQRALDNLLRERTALVIAHRLSTVLHADRILVMRGGRIVEDGTHGDLLARRGSYWRLYQAQLAGAVH